MEVLSGGRDDAIFKQNDTVIRPLSAHSEAVHRLLTHLHQEGFTSCPQFISSDGKNEILSFVEGETYNYPLRGAIASDEALMSAARLLRQFHDASATFLQHDHRKQHWMLPTREPAEVICHGDFAPYNVALKGQTVLGVFDFDTAHPAPRLWDIAYAVYCWAPFKTHHIDKLGSLDQQIARAKMFLDAYGVSEQERVSLVSTMVQRLHALVTFMVREAEDEDPGFQMNLSEGHHIAYLNDIEYLKLHQSKIQIGLI